MINTFLLFIGKTCLSGKHLYKFTEKFNAALSPVHGKSLPGLVHLIAQLHYVYTY